MLEDARMTAAVPVRDLEKARRFWEETIGLAPHLEREAQGVVMYVHNNTALLVYRTEAELGGATKAVFVVDNLIREMAELKERGVAFEDRELPGYTTLDGIAEGPLGMTAWFKDPEGNFIGLAQLIRG